MDRVDALIGVKVDVIVVDSAHGHSKNILEEVNDKIKYPGSGHSRKYCHGKLLLI